MADRVSACFEYGTTYVDENGQVQKYLGESGGLFQGVGKPPNGQGGKPFYLNRTEREYFEGRDPDPDPPEEPEPTE